jgi:preprotein translocase subunit SecG
MSFFIGFLTVILVLNCLLLILLVLIQLPKKEAGAGLAFGGATTDALFGAGSGNALTKITKYATVVFFVMAMVLAVLQNHYHNRNLTEFERGLQQQTSQLPAQGQPALPSGNSVQLPATESSVSNALTLPVEPAPVTVPPTQN